MENKPVNALPQSQIKENANAELCQGWVLTHHRVQRALTSPVLWFWGPEVIGHRS